LVQRRACLTMRKTIRESLFTFWTTGRAG
jgi:hypothetical protein